MDVSPIPKPMVRVEPPSEGEGGVSPIDLLGGFGGAVVEAGGWRCSVVDAPAYKADERAL